MDLLSTNNRCPKSTTRTLTYKKIFDQEDFALIQINTNNLPTET